MARVEQHRTRSAGNPHKRGKCILGRTKLRRGPWRQPVPLKSCWTRHDRLVDDACCCRSRAGAARIFLLCHGTMVVSISDPYHLATYSVNPGGPRANPFVFSSFTILPDLTSGWVTLTVQGDGIHIMDVSEPMPPIMRESCCLTVFCLARVAATYRIAYVRTIGILLCSCYHHHTASGW